MVHVPYIVIFVVSIVDGIPLLGPCSLLLKIESSRRLIDFIIVFGRSCMTYETKHITFSCHTCESEQRLLMFKNFTIECCNLQSRVHIVTVEKIHVESIVECGQRRNIVSSVMPKLMNLFWVKRAEQTTLIIFSPKPHAYEVSCIKDTVQMACNELDL